MKNRWYNVKTSEKKAKKKAEQALRESLEAELAASRRGDQKPAAKQESQTSRKFEHVSDRDRMNVDVGI